MHDAGEHVEREASDANAIAAGATRTWRDLGAGEHTCPIAPGTHVLIGERDQVYLGRTGDGRYAFVDADRFGRFDGSVPRHRIVSRLGTEMDFGHVEPTSSAPMDRRDRRTRVG